MNNQSGTPEDKRSVNGAAEDLTKEEVLEILRNVYDPDLQMNIVDLGLVYDVRMLPDGRWHVVMTLTSSHCPYGSALVAEVKSMLMMTGRARGVEVSVVWDPPWSADKLSEAARLALGLDL